MIWEREYEGAQRVVHIIKEIPRARGWSPRPACPGESMSAQLNNPGYHDLAVREAKCPDHWMRTQVPLIRLAATQGVLSISSESSYAGRPPLSAH